MCKIKANFDLNDYLFLELQTNGNDTTSSRRIIVILPFFFFFLT